MKWELLWLGCLFPIMVAGRSVKPVDQEEALDYLIKYGYLQKPLERKTDGFGPEEVTEAVRSFQAVSELPTSGQLDWVTRTRMGQPRCGLEDPFNQKTQKYLLLGRWRKRHLTFRILNWPSTLPIHTARTSLLTAFRYWSRVASLSFREVHAGWADIRLSFHGQHSLHCSQGFDGPGKVLAHADIPESGSVHFDQSETWTEGTKMGVNLRIIAAHELGHALGLGHSRYPQALMAPVYSGFRPHFQLHPDDVAGIQALYGKRIPPSGEEEEKVDKEEERNEVSIVTPGPSMLGAVPDPCKGELDAMMLGPHGKTYAFKGDYVWTVTSSRLGPIFPVATLWKGLPGNLDAAVYSPRTKWTYFFKGNMIWRYMGFKLVPGFPKRLSQVEPNLDAALYWPLNQKVFLFKGSGYWQWDELAVNDFSRYPKPIGKLFTGVPDKPLAALSWQDGKVYFFKGKNYWRLNKQLRVEKGFPKDTSQNWMHCLPPTMGIPASATSSTPRTVPLATNRTTSFSAPDNSSSLLPMTTFAQ